MNGLSGRATVHPPVRVRTGNAKQDAARADLERDAAQATASPLAGAVFVKGAVPDVGNTVELHHRLGRLPQGAFVLMGEEGGARLHRVKWDTMSITLAPDADASVDVLFTVCVF